MKDIEVCMDFTLDGGRDWEERAGTGGDLVGPEDPEKRVAVYLQISHQLWIVHVTPPAASI